MLNDGATELFFTEHRCLIRAARSFAAENTFSR